MTGSSPQADRQRGNDGMTSSHNRPRVGRHLPGSWGLLPILMGLCVVLWTWRASGANQAPASEVGGVRARQGETPPRDSARPVGAADERAEFVRLMNTGKAHLENGSFDKAVESLTAALEIRPRSTPALRNLARAYLFSGELDLAIERLAEAREAEPGSVATAYLTGLALARQTRFEAATPYFEQAARLDAGRAAIRFQLAQAYQATGNEQKAFEQLRQVVRLDPQHSAAQFQLAMRARKENDTDEYRRRLREFVRLRDRFGDPSKTPLALEFCVHTKAEPPVRDIEEDAAAAPAQKIDVRFTDASAEVFVKATDRSASALAVIDMDKHGRYTFFVADHDGGLSLMTLSPAGKVDRRPLGLELRSGADIQDCIVGNYHDDIPKRLEQGTVPPRFADVMLIGENDAYLLKRTDAETFEDVTDRAGLADLGGRAARWVDYEYDGDLDLLVARKTGLQLWQNNGNGTFQNVTAEVGIPNSIHCLDVSTADLDGNGAVDFIAARGVETTLVYENQRAGRLGPMPEPPGPWLAARRVFMNDLANDGHPDVLLAGQERATILFGSSSARQHIDFSDLSLVSGAFIDYDNDGWLDFSGVGRSRADPDKGEIRLWRNGGSGPWTDVTAALLPDEFIGAPLRDVAAADLDADGDTDLLLLSADSQLQFLRNDGGHVNRQLKLRLVSLMANRSGIGTHVELTKGDYWVTRFVDRELPIEIGLAGHAKLDTVQTVWTNGVVDNRMNIAAKREPLNIVIIRWAATGSCPYLYAWDGKGFRFVTDLLGSGALGLSLSRDAVWIPDPHEIVLIGDSDQFRPLNGAYTLKITSELREVDYIDFCKILAVDHPRHVEIHSTDKFMLPPFSPSKVTALAHPIRPDRAEGDDGIDRTESLQEIDGVFAPPGPILPDPLQGVCRPMSITLDFGRLDTDRPLVLALTGWLEYGTASSNIALSQDASAKVIWPMLETDTADGKWVSLDVNVGMPAGKTKTILCDLDGKLPQNARRLRLTTTFEILWDRIALFERQASDLFQVRELSFTQANLDWRGFSDIRSRAPGHPTTPDYDNLFTQPPWRTTLEGWCTRFGDVRELIAHADGKLVVLNGGDALTLSCPAENLPAVSGDKVRTFFLYSVGWDKEDNANTVDGDTVEPLPGGFDVIGTQAEMAVEDWRVRYNTRWIPRHRFDPNADRKTRVRRDDVSARHPSAGMTREKTP